MPRTAASGPPAQPVAIPRADRIVRAASEPGLLFSMLVEDAMRHFGLGHDDLQEAKARAMADQPEAVAQAMRARSRDRRFDRMVRAESRHADIHRRMAAGSESDAELGRAYSLSRVRVGQLHRDLVEAAPQRRMSVERLAGKVADAARALQPA